ncbi:MAG: MATE family efflux transporter [Lachnospiraceae bacterium]|nr:MATE family efflux transporter [Lachnospiraceae bacterium]
MGIKKTRTADMTSGPIMMQLIRFSLPLLLGNVFQMLYNTVDSLVVGNFVGTEALAAVGSTTMIINILVLFFNGLAVGAGVLIGQLFGAQDKDTLHTAVETTMSMTFIFSVLFTIIGVAGVPLMLKLMSTPADVMEPASLYLRIYFSGISGMLIYNMGGGILRAVGDSIRPLEFLIFTSVMNTILDLFFVLGLHKGIAGVAIATVISQFCSALLILRLLVRTDEIYYFRFSDLCLNLPLLGTIFRFGLPAAIQSTLTAFSNTFVQSYINTFGSSCMAGWSCYNKLDQFVFLPIVSMNMAATAFVSQNIGAGQVKRANKGTGVALAMISVITIAISSVLVLFAREASAIFTSDQAVIEFSVLFLSTNTMLLIFNSINHVLAGALRGRGDSFGPMIIMVSTFVVIRQIYLFVVTRFFINTPKVVGFGYPIGWMSCCIIQLLYFYFRWLRPSKKEA